MRLQSLEVNGFKSFPTQTSLTFDASIAGIVGPNGSGKSNIAEAFRFVLGEQSMKSMRGNKSADMIFNGSRQHPRSNRAHVKVILNNDDRLLDIDFHEVTIERVVHRDGKHQYYLNGSPVRLKDIRELISGAHIGSSGHHIISQGEADKIVDAKPDERKSMIEDALGLRVYRNRRRESENKLTRTDENIETTKNLRRDIAPRLGHLKREKEKIEKVREMRKEIQERYREYLARERIILDTRENDLNKRSTPLYEKKERLEQERDDVQEHLAHTHQSDDQDNPLRIRLHKIDEELSHLDTDRNTITQEIGRIEGEIASYERTIASAQNIQTENANKKVYLAHVEDTYAYITEQIAEAESAGTIEKAYEVFQAIRHSLDNFIRANTSEQDDATIKDARSAITELSKKRESREQDRSQIEQTRKDRMAEYKQISDQLANQKQEHQDAEQHIYKIQAQISEVRNALENLEAESRALVTRRERFREEVARAGEFVGHSALEYKTYQPCDNTGQAYSVESIIDEDDRGQRERYKEIERLAIRIEDNCVDGTDDIIKEYNDLSEQDAFLARELEDLEGSAKSLRNLIADLDMTLEQEFTKGLQQINERFQSLFEHMFGGGTARLRRTRTHTDDTDSMSDISQHNEIHDKASVNVEGVELHVNPPHKKIQGLQMLSGGERSLVSIALLFAMSQINPPPFIILDETDAALDEANAKKYGDLIERLATHSQLIVITHNRETMSRAGVLYGVTMAGTGASNILSVAFDSNTVPVAE